MESGLVLNLDQSKHGPHGEKTSRKVSGSRVKRIGNRRKEKKKQWKERLKLGQQTSEELTADQKESNRTRVSENKNTEHGNNDSPHGGGKLDVIHKHTGNIQWSKRKSNEDSPDSKMRKSNYDAPDVKKRKSNDDAPDSKMRKSNDDVPDVKKRKTGKGGSMVISSLFRCNPEIPKVVSSKVAKSKEDVFTTNSFKDLPLHPFMLKTLEDHLHLQQMTSVQKRAIPTILDGHDALVKSQTGSGKTLAFAIPIVQTLQSLKPSIQRSTGLHAVVVVPTREENAYKSPKEDVYSIDLKPLQLALQCFQVFLQLVKPFIRIVPGILIGGEKRKAEKARLSKGINILVCTPGRLVDHLQNTASLTLDRVQFLVLDEADRLCDLGYEKNIAEIVTALNNRSQRPRQTILLSATLSEGVERLAGISMDNPKHIFLSESEAATPSSLKAEKDKTQENSNNHESYSVPENLKQYFVITPCKLRLVTLAAFILWKCQLGDHSNKMVVFMSTQDSVAFHHQLFTEVFGESSELATATGKHNVKVFRLHGDMQQKDRTEVFNTFSQSKHGLLLCTDVAARGLDLAHVQWIVQYTAPSQEADYVHRIGRTARAGMQGQSLLFVMPSEVEYIRVLNKHNISLEEMKMKRILTCLVPVIADLNSNQDEGQMRNKPRDLIESATYLQMKFESVIHGKQEILNSARRGYQSFIRAYATYPSHLKSVFQIRDLHLGHVAKTFGLREAPGGIGDRAGQLEKKKKKKTKQFNRSSVKRVKKSLSEFDSGLSGKKHKTLGPKKKKKKKKAQK